MKRDPLPNFDFEIQGSSDSQRCIIGVDEVGRGALAGPVVAGAVCIFNTMNYPDSDCYRDWVRYGIDDSKRLTERKREELSKTIQEGAIWGIGEVGVEVINEIGIAPSTHLAMIQAVENLNLKLSASSFHLLVDGLMVPAFRERGWSHQAIVKGDQKSISIAAASIVAKVFRDKLMRDLSLNSQFRSYGWGENKGYGTKIHLEAIRTFGSTVLHRRDFLRSGE